jgi:hypothetical protein
MLDLNYDFSMKSYSFVKFLKPPSHHGNFLSMQFRCSSKLSFQLTADLFIIEQWNTFFTSAANSTVFGPLPKQYHLLVPDQKFHCLFIINDWPFCFKFSCSYCVTSLSLLAWNWYKPVLFCSWARLKLRVKYNKQLITVQHVLINQNFNFTIHHLSPCFS